MELPPDQLGSGTTVVTVNRRLARVLREQFAAARALGTAPVWESPDIVPYGAWLERLWTMHCERREADVPALLGAEQELAIWEQVITAHGRGETDLDLLQGGAAARAAREAWVLLKEWRLGPEDDLGDVGEDTLTFLAWARGYLARCRDSGWTDHASLPERITRDLPGEPGDDLREILLVGFDRLTPRQQALFDALAEAGVTVRSTAPPRQSSRARRLGFADQESELYAAASWARQRIDAGDAGPVGVVVPELGALRARVERIFLDVLHPGHGRPGGEDPPRAFNISLGLPLTGIPLASDALLALTTLSDRLTREDLGRWLLSPYLDLGELPWRARVDAELRRLGEPEWRLATLAQWIRRVGEAAARPAPARVPDRSPTARLLEVIERLRGRIDELPRRQSVSRWAGTFSEVMKDSGWPGPRPLSSREFQALEAVQSLLAEFAALGPVLPELSLGQALTRLRRQAGRHIFQPQTAPAPVQVLGVLEASGLSYSALWLTGLHDTAWPQAPRPNPFLPLALQRRLAMPRASPEQQLEWATTWTGRMLASAPEVMVSYPRQTGEEATSPSPLIVHLEALETDPQRPLPGPGEAPAMHDRAPALEVIDDERAPALAPGSAVHGGVSVLRDQSACPFRAFALHRLGAVDVSAPASSLDARVRGTVAHRLLELLWRRLETHARLVAQSPDQRAALISEAVAQALEGEIRRRPVTLRGRMLALERGRLTALAGAWLAIEEARRPFRVTPERGGQARIAELTLNVRPDRVDRTDDGQLFIVDYKTGRASPAQWMGERPEEPQLPFYAIALEGTEGDRIAGIAFAVLRPGALGFLGVGGVDGLAPGVETLDASRRRIITGEAPDWPSLMGLWRERLEGLAGAFGAGDARVDPREPGTTCRYCGLQPLCRVHEHSLADADP